MTKTHITLQGKGGVGKSFSATVLAQWLIERQRAPLCIDTDPNNRTFSGYTALNVTALDILEDEQINTRRFDVLIERIAAASGDVVIDNGASSFIPFSHYLLSNHVPALLDELRHPLVLHVLVTGGQSMTDTLHGLAQVATQFPRPAELVVWLNPFWGPIEHAGKPFDEMRVYTEHRERIGALVRIPALKAETFGADLVNLLSARRTFREALELPATTIMERQRLKSIRDRLFAELDAACL